MVSPSKNYSETFVLLQDTPVVMITNYCNLNCPFCFARREMTTNRSREMSLEDFRFLCKRLKESNFTKISLLGGEPTLHKYFGEIVKYSLRNFFLVNIYTNGLFSDNISSILEMSGKQINLTFNISSPAFLSPKTKQIIIEKIFRLSNYTHITLSVVNNFLKKEFIKELFEPFPKDILTKIHISLSIPNPVSGEKNFISFDNYKKIGFGLYSFVRYLLKAGPPKSINIRDGVTRCMFTDGQYDYLKNHCFRVGKGISSRSPGEKGLFDISVNLQAFSDFPLSNTKRIQIDEKTSLLSIRDQFIKLRKYYGDKYMLDICKTCLYRLDKKDPCPGPNLAFRINELNNKSRS